MFCTNCGNKIPDNVSFCPSCGAKTPNVSTREKVAAAVDAVEASVNQAASGVEAEAQNAFNNLENDLNRGFNQGNANQSNQYQSNQYQPNGYQPNGYQQNGYQAGPNPNAYGGELLQTDRSLLAYILLSIVTCGIYSWYFIYKLAKDVNVCCDGDGENTPGLLMFLLLSLVTCGIYSYIWFYKLGNRLNRNAARYGMMFTENGTTILMWQLFGVLLCGIGPFIALNIIIKNTNMLCLAYNNYNSARA